MKLTLVHVSLDASGVLACGLRIDELPDHLGRGRLRVLFAMRALLI